IPRPPCPTPFPYTTLFRSFNCRRQRSVASRRHFSVRCCGMTTHRKHKDREEDMVLHCRSEIVFVINRINGKASAEMKSHRTVFRSEEHTSELQSRENLVCR